MAKKIVRLTLFKVYDPGVIQEAIQKYSTLSQDAVKVQKIPFVPDLNSPFKFTPFLLLLFEACITYPLALFRQHMKHLHTLHVPYITSLPNPIHTISPSPRLFFALRSGGYNNDIESYTWGTLGRRGNVSAPKCECLLC